MECCYRVVRLFAHQSRTALWWAVAAILFAFAALDPAIGQGSFDHFSTGFPLTGSHRTVECSSCHIGGRFKGTQTQCASCHNGAQTAGMSVNHPKTTTRCESCHQTSTWKDIRTIDHTQAKAPCAACHNGLMALGKPTNHITTTAPCDACHRTTASFRVAMKMDHTGIVAGCANCHNGTVARGKPSGHVPTALPCESCHARTASFAGAAFQHRTTDANCASCHNGQTALGMTTPPHIPVTGIQCSNCHNNTAAAFNVYTMSHAAVSASRCDSCHNGSYTGQGNTGALGTKSYPNHVATNGQDCITCHTTAASGGFKSWGGGGFKHAATDTNCAICHNGKTAQGMTTPPHVPVTGLQCSNCHSNTAAAFDVYTMNHAAVSASRCDSCHNGGYTGQGTKGAMGTASYPNHVPTNGQDCISCHSTAASGGYTSWGGGGFKHAATDTNCATCHNGKTAQGMTTPPHIPTGTLQCSNCHTNTAASFATYTMSHAAVSTSRCDSCHNGSYTGQGTKGAMGTASYPNHIATNGQDCITCHAKAASGGYTSWGGAGFKHAATDTNCATCHNGKTAQGMTTPPHIPTGTLQCSNCHTNGAASFATYTMNHSAVSTSRCDSCHSGSYTGQGTKGAMGTASYPNHVATNGQDCISCHSTAASGGFSSWGGGAFKHAATDTNCAACHNGKTAQGMTTPPHIPTGTLQCSNCHTNTAASFATYTMNHSAVSTARCDSCHNGSYTGQGTKGAMGTASYPNHVATNGQDCITCHSTAASSGYASWSGGAFKHAATDTNCATCHNGKTAQGMTTPPHIPIGTLQCSNCHSNTAASFAGYTMNHAAVSTSRCDSCHNGSYTGQGTKGAMGTASYPNHVATGGQDCISCHATAASGGYTSWGGAGFKHAATDTNCATCHNGKTAQGMTTPPHIPVTGLQCSSCHANTAASFASYTMNHSAVSTSRCDSCHNGSYTGQGTKGAMGTASYPNHVATNGQDCITCHSTAASGGYTSWGGAGFKHAATDTNCATCHNGKTAQGMTTPPHIPTSTLQCSNCHTNTAASFATYTMSHSAVSTARCDSCHNGSYTGQGSKGAMGTASYPNHVATGGQDCISCHATAASGSYTNWGGAGFKHAATDTNCATCHNGKIAQGMTTPPHIPTSTLQCSNCHTNTAASFTTYTMNHSAVSTSRCDSCHNGSYTGQGSKGAMGTASYPNHVATGGQDCISCHSTAASGGYSSWGGGAFRHAATDTNCATCHNGKTAQGMTTPPHIPTGTLQCSNCHSNTAASFTTYTMNHAAVSTSRCDSCHSGSYTGQGTKGAMGTASYPNHVATGGQDCISCHSTAASGGYSSWGGGAFKHAATDTNCATCHNGKTAQGMTTPPHIPTGTLQCSNCHTNTAASFATYTMNHSAVSTSRCDSCHNGSYAGQGTKGAMGTASYPNHVATGGQDCITCHAKAASGGYTSWGGAGFKHAATDTNCATCHNGKTAQGMTTPPHIPTGALQCSNCHTNTAASFATYTMSHAAVSTSRCDSCHNGSYTGQGTKGAMGTASFAGHVPTNGADCGSCHTKAASGGFVSWAGAAFTHTAANTNCSSCHNGSAAMGMTTPPHIPTGTLQCSNCHTNTAASFATYTMNHSAVHATRCDSCHSGAYRSQGRRGAQGPGHGAKAQDCGCCHQGAAANFSTWDDDPRGSAGGCTTTAKALTPANPTLKSATAATANRTMTTPPANSPQAATAPSSTAPAATAVAPSANTAILFSNKPVAANPIASAPTPAGNPANDNVAAGTAAKPDPAPKPGALPTFSAASQSANPQAAAPALGQVPSNDPRTRLSPTIGRPAAEQAEPSAGGLPSFDSTKQLRPGLAGFGASSLGAGKFDHLTARGPCASCHNGRDATGKPQAHIATNAPCDTCHKSTVTFAGARFSHTGTTAACSSCHNGTVASGKPQKHVATNAPCETCHKSTVTFAGARFDHAGTTAACSSCHNGIIAAGKPQKHVATNAPCETCHKSTVTFAGARFDHAGTTAACSSCHNGIIAAGKPQKHVATNAPCETCHKSTATFAGARFNHTGATAPCASCHNGTTATGKPQRHIVTNAACDTCHKSTVSFSGARMDHATLSAPCASCHNGTTASGKSPRHFVTNAPCESCHRSVSWTSVTYQHMSASFPNHGAAIGCVGCHSSNSQVVLWKFAAYKPDCAACHASDFHPQQHTKYLKPVPMNYTAAELRDCTGACHVFADQTQTTIVTRRPKAHRVNGGGW